ncbi:g10108 [Coccomyxa elongata]
MPSHRRSSESGPATGMEPSSNNVNVSPAAADKRRSIPLPNMETASRLKTYVGNAINSATAAPAWLASKAVPVAADGAGLLRNAAADRVALFRRGTQYDELEEEEDEAMKRRTMALSSSDTPPQPSTRKANVPNQGQDKVDGVGSEVSPSGRSANGPPSARSSTQEEEPAMILFDEDEEHPPQLRLGPPSEGGAHVGVDRAARPSSAASSVSAASDLLCDGWPPRMSCNGGLRAPPMSAAVAGPMLTPPPKPPGRPDASRTSPGLNRPAAIAQPSPDPLSRRSPYAALRPSPEAAAALKTPQLSFVSDDSAMEVPLGMRSAGSASGSPLVQQQQVEEAGPLAQGMGRASLQPQMSKGTPPPAPRPSRPPPPPPTDHDLLGHGDARGLMVSRQSSASSSVPERGTLRRTTEDSEAGGGGGNASWDIFEPRVGTDANGASTKPLSASPSGAVTDLSALKHMTGRQLLASLEAGTPVRKKWVTRLSAEEAAAAAKTTRHVRCFVRGGKVTLRYLHQGVKGLLDRGEMCATVQRVEVPGGNWAPGASITVFTSRGTLLLEPLGPAAYSQWVLGLNAALVACQTRRKEYVYACPAHTIPRNSMFIVADARAAAAAPAGRYRANRAVTTCDVAYSCGGLIRHLADWLWHSMLCNEFTPVLHTPSPATPPSSSPSRLLRLPR